MKENWVEHVAVRVNDLEWHCEFFKTALGMEVTEVQGKRTSPSQVWVGGFQLTRDIGFTPEARANERVWHVGVNVRNLNEASRAVAAYPGVSRFSSNPGQEYWFVLPEGLVIELLCRNSG